MTVAGWVATVCTILLFITWVGYPAVIALLASLPRGKRPGSWTRMPGVSVILATREAPDAVKERVDDLLRADYGAPFQILVALDRRMCSAEDPAWAHPDKRVHVLIGDTPGGKTAALNAAVRAAAEDVLIFADTAQRFHPSAIGYLVAALADDRIGAVSGALRLPGDRDRPSPAERYWKFERWLRRNEARVHSTVGVSGSIYAMRRDRWVPLPPELILDDVYVPMRLALEGFRVGFEERAVAVDLRRTTAAQEYRRKVRTLTGNLQLCAWLPAVLLPIRNPIWIQFVCHKLLRLLTPYLLVALLAALAWAGALALGPTLPVAALVLILCAVVVLLVPSLRDRAKAVSLWFFALQAAVIVATLNGMRRRWNVWGT